jgi:hypothetical protein
LSSLVAQTSPDPLALMWHAPAWPHHPAMLWTASLLHLSELHLWVNMGALLVLALLGGFLRALWPATLAALLAWPLGTMALVFWPDIAYFAGMSGLLTAMLAVLCVHAALQDGTRIAAVVLCVGLVLKLLSERAWSHPIVFDPAWGFNVVNAAHLTGALAGAGSALLVRAIVALRA